MENEELPLIAATSGENGKIKFHHQIPDDALCLLFYKIPQVGGVQAATSMSFSKAADNQQIALLTLEGGMVKSMYNSLSRVFSPHAIAKVKKKQVTLKKFERCFFLRKRNSVRN